jgi:DNA primase small subunit
MAEGKMTSKEFLTKAFRGYYFRRIGSVEAPEEIASREFGYLNFDDVMIRHISFQNEGELKAMLFKETPRSAYCSVAYYDSPSLSMDEKGYRKADLAFDIDSDDLNLSCTEEHDFRICSSCGKPFKKGGDSCPSCGSSQVSTVHWACDKCLTAAKEEAQKLVDFLELDLGVLPSDIRVHFSGNRGYHLSVVGSKYETIDQRGRSEIVEYIAGKGLTSKQLGLMLRRPASEILQRLPFPEEPGWRGRVAGAFGKIQGMESREAVAKALAEHPEAAEGLVGKAVEMTGVRVDAGVTIDIHRVFRMGGTLHDKSGLIKKRYQRLEEADPMTDAVGLGGEPVKVSILYSPRFNLLGSGFGPYEAAHEVLPTYAAAYLMAKGLASLE